MEEEYHPLYAAPYNMGTTVWSPLMSGVLTGKYNDAIPEGSRLTQPGYEWLVKMLDGHRKSGVIDKVRALTAFAESELDCTMAELALAWVLGNPNVTTILLGATQVSQLEENLRAIDVARRMTAKHREAIEQIVGNKPTAYQGWGGAGMRSFATL
jgi:aryl-alcohol dehydrogenase-like predicted oxidoreductase